MHLTWIQSLFSQQSIAKVLAPTLKIVVNRVEKFSAIILLLVAERKIKKNSILLNTYNEEQKEQIKCKIFIITFVGGKPNSKNQEGINFNHFQTFVP